MSLKLQYVNTNLGRIAVFSKNANSSKKPIVFLHGLFFDHEMWPEEFINASDCPVFLIDMPLHGLSVKNISSKWNLDDCATMLIEILDALNCGKIFGVGHSWGSMTLLRAARKHPEKFEKLLLLNLPFLKLNYWQKNKIRLLYIGLMFKTFYIRMAANVLFDKSNLNPKHVTFLQGKMSQISNNNIRQLDKIVRIDADDSSHLFAEVLVPFLVLVAKNDWVQRPPTIHTKDIDGGHTSPIEVPEQVLPFLTNQF